MPQKGQTAKHEWKRSYSSRWRTCTHCKVDRYAREGGGHEYHIRGLPGQLSTVSYDEPPCITRKIHSDEIVQQHEWYLHHIDCAGDEILRCGFCPVKKRINEDGIELYGTYQDGWESEEEPPCITRTLKTEDHEKTT